MGAPSAPYFLLVRGTQASPMAECLLYLVCHYTITLRGKDRAWAAGEQEGPHWQPGTAGIF